MEPPPDYVGTPGNPSKFASCEAQVIQYRLSEGVDRATDYVARHLPTVVEGASDPQITYLDAGIMNYVYRVDLPGETLFLKQALEKVKQHDRLGPDLAGVSPARIAAEANALTLLAEHLTPEFWGCIPEVAWYDEPNNVLWTREIAPGATSLQKRLEAGEFDVDAARRLGVLLAAMHSACDAPPLWPTVEEDDANWERFLKMRTVGVLHRAELPHQAEVATQSLLEDGREHARRGMISHLDAAPKNVLVGSEGQIALLDFELGAAISDPAYDPGFLAGHYLLMGANREDAWSPAIRAAAALAEGYQDTAPAVDPEWETRCLHYAALTMLYRVYGSSPAPYLDPNRYAAIRAQALGILTGPL
jgi:hypothetical protein